jgi:Uma2 family endonuclease
MSTIIDDQDNHSVEELFEFDSQRELIGGRFFSLEEAYHPAHQKVSFRIKKELQKNLTNDTYQAIMYPFFLQISTKDVVKPDVMLTTEFNAEEHYSSIPEIVVEVLSISTSFKDNDVKLKLYEKEHILYYMVIDPKIGDIKIYKLQEGKYELIATPQKRSNFEFILTNGKTSIDFNNVY